jgi:glycosyltransferase involved in cell wall biosynthesis
MTTPTVLAAPAPTVPLRLGDLRDRHRGETILVCGCGESLNDLTQPNRFITIGVNDIGRRFHPNYLVVVNPRSQFSGDRFRYIKESRAACLFTQLDLGVPHPQIVRFRLGAYGGTDFSDSSVLHYTQNSPYVALCLAVHMGARRIGLIGVDFTDHHFFAKTGAHPLAARLAEIDREYATLARACHDLGIEIINLSRQSKLTAFSKGTTADLGTGGQPVPEPDQVWPTKRVFCVNYRFLSCGDVFTVGLRNAAREVRIQYEDAYWDDANLPAKICAFGPDLVLVVHGRRFMQRWGDALRSYKSAVWLLDEPYEVDDTAQWSCIFDTVFVNDPSTLSRHRNSRYLPVAYDPEVHRDDGDAKRYQVGFVGGHNVTRERYLLGLQQAGLLSYVVGGPWKARQLDALCLQRNIPPQATASLYRQTRVVVNAFRDLHHFNRSGVRPFSMNPRIYEALACGAVVVSEDRDEVAEVFPELPRFSDAKQLVEIVAELLASEERHGALKDACRVRLRSHRYSDRLRRILQDLDSSGSGALANRSIGKPMAMEPAKMFPARFRGAPEGWQDCGGISELQADGCIAIRKPHDEGPGTEQGLASANAYRNVDLTFEVNLESDACFIAKVHQIGQHDQTSNSYHLFCHPGRTYLAMHHRIFQDVHVPRGKWESIGLRRSGDLVELMVGEALVARVRNGTLASGYCFLGVKGGGALLRNVKLSDGTRLHQSSGTAKDTGPRSPAVPLPPYRVLMSSPHQELPTVSIVTTVYDRVECLRECVRSVRQLRYPHLEHIIVSDHPPQEVVDRILQLLVDEPRTAVTYADLAERFNNWGIAPASVGVHLARGRYVCFLSDDNAYAPDHLTPLVSALNGNSRIGFAYSSCRYAGRHVLRSSMPRPGGIDLGQPLFRKELFDCYLPGALPFDMMAWDWHMIEAFMRRGVKWRHVDRPTFLFRAAACK